MTADVTDDATPDPARDPAPAPAPITPENAYPRLPVVPVEGRLVPGDHRVAIVAARFNEYIVDRLLEGAVATWAQLGGEPTRLSITRVPGAFELGVAARRLAEDPEIHAVVCLGCVIRGETDHYDHVVEQAAQGVKDAGVLTGTPCIFGVLTCDNLEQAISRAGSKHGHAGRSAMLTAVEMADLMARLPGG